MIYQVENSNKEIKPSKQIEILTLESIVFDMKNSLEAAQV